VSVLPAKRNFTIWRGGTWRESLTLYDGTTNADPPRDLTGYDASMRVEGSDGTDLFTLTTTPSPSGSITLGGTAGTVTLLIDAATTAALTWTAARYELFLIDPVSEVQPLLWGGLTVKGV
jgi:hypothetical protein